MYIKKLGNSGDTIVEVMVALAILALAFTISYATVSHALQVSQNSQEHSYALELLDSQIELARSGVAGLYSPPPSTYVMAPNTPFCMNPANDQPVASSDEACKPTNGGASYKISILYAPAQSNDVNQDIFTFNISWDGIGNLGNQQESLSYKLHQGD